MLNFVGRGTAHTCDGTTRRDFLQVGSLGVAGLSLAQYIEAKEQGHVAGGHDERSCIMIFNLGAPSQLDTFDMKPEAPLEVRGPFKPISTSCGNYHLSEILPKIATISEHVSLVRSCYHTGAAVHDAGWQMMQTGRQFAGGVNSPHAGSVVSYLKGRRTDLPPFVVLPETMGRGGGNLPNGQAGGFLGKAHDPFALMADPSKPDFKVPDLLPQRTSVTCEWLVVVVCEILLIRPSAILSRRERDDDGSELRRGLPSDDKSSGSRRIRFVEGASVRSRTLRHESFRPVLFVVTTTGRSWRAVRDDQHVPHRVR